MIEHRPDVKALTPVETQHITAVCRESRTLYGAWEDAVHRLLHVYEAQVFRRPGATVSLALYVSDPDGGQPDTPAPEPEKCPQCHFQPIADGYSVCELCAYSPAVVSATAVVSAPVAANPQTDSVTPDTPAPTRSSEEAR